MKKLIERDDRGVAILDTTKKRLVFSFTVLFGFIGIIFCFVTLFFIPYWIFTGKNIFKELLDI